ncbi:MaoC/PaaZ C-terminal domain-containing protein [Geoglobus acetivorans]|uniref:MaoC family dehydratase N-terminal domain-containing protein n=1 Tax=Geoglobus acetivorans TaxID=565033 RepID=A0ABZ3H786_GEOAI|nr:MaoC family dehydratase N-terminal domain-containing protein [Geoglobus acetivorans]
MNREPLYFEAINVGDAVESIPRTIVESDIWMFAYLTGDFFPLHTDVEFSRNTVFGERIAQGMLVLSVALGMIDQVLLSRYDVSSVVAFYGIEDVRFLEPVFIGDTIRARAEVVEKRDAGEKSGVVTYRLEVINQKNEVVLIARYSALIRKSPVK